MGIGIGAPRGKEGEKEQRVSGNRDRSTMRERRGEGTEGEWE